MSEYTIRRTRRLSDERPRSAVNSFDIDDEPTTMQFRPKRAFTQINIFFMQTRVFHDFDDFAASVRDVESKMLLRNAEQRCWSVSSVEH